MQVSIQTIVDNAIDLADMRNSQFVDTTDSATSEMMRYVNLAYNDVYQRIVKSSEFYFTTETVISISPSTDTYSLPADLFKLDGVDVVISGYNTAQERRATVRRFEFLERNKYRSTAAANMLGLVPNLRYSIRGDDLLFCPVPQQTWYVRIYYTPNPTTVDSFSDTIEVIPGVDVYMSYYIANMMLGKEESDQSPTAIGKAEALQNIISSLPARDMGYPSGVVDESSINIGSLWPWNGGA